MTLGKGRTVPLLISRGEAYYWSNQWQQGFARQWPRSRRVTTSGSTRRTRPTWLSGCSTARSKEAAETGAAEAHSVIVPKPLKKSLAKKPPKMQAAILEAVTQLRKDPHHPGLHVHRVQGRQDIFEARIDNKNRLTFFWDEGDIVLENHCNHDILDERR